MKYLKVATVKEAQAVSRNAWLTRLGRKKNTEDVTEFMFDVVDNPKDGSALVVIPVANEELLPAVERAALLAADHADVKALYVARSSLNSDLAPLNLSAL